jgi:NitT/TauT family transport system permease protein
MSGLVQGSGAVQRLGMTLMLGAAIILGMTQAATGQPSTLVLSLMTAAVVLAFAADARPTGAGALPQPPGPRWWPMGILLLICALLAGTAAGLMQVAPGSATAAFWCAVIAVWLGAWMVVAQLSDLPLPPGRAERFRGLLAPFLFGLTLLWLWQTGVRGGGVPNVILPAPSDIALRFADSADVLWGDFVQTFVKGALSGYAIGVAAALVFAVLVDRSDFLRRGLLPVGNFVAALPIVGTAPIMVMWFGFGWESKAAVVVAMVFFPMLVNTVQGLTETEAMQRDLMRTYSASYWQGLWKLRLPAAMPFIFNGLKICSTLALIGAIVAEFFGSPTRGMGFRISTEVGRLNLDMVWSEIAVAAIAGSAFYGILAALERGVTFWHPSQRGR